MREAGFGVLFVSFFIADNLQAPEPPVNTSFKFFFNPGRAGCFDACWPFFILGNPVPVGAFVYVTAEAVRITPLRKRPEPFTSKEATPNRFRRRYVTGV